MAKRPRSRPPYAMVERAFGGRLRPVAAYDAAVIDQARPGTVYDLVPRRDRGHKLQGLYWSVLNAIVEATDVVPTSAHLHSQVVRHCGYVRTILNPLTGAEEDVRDSTAYDAMSEDEFSAYVTRAFAALSEVLGVDPLDLLPDREGRP